MLLQIILALIIGIFAGTITGLIPGIHINLVGVFLISLSSTILIGISPVYFAVFIVAMAITHTFVDFIPSVFLGCPDTDTELAVLPGHELLKNGEGYQAVLLSVYGSLFAILVLIIIAYPSMLILPKIHELTKNIMLWILISISMILILIERRKLVSLGIFLLTGILGFLILNLENLKQPLLPLLTGLFGASMIIASIKNKTKVPEQKTEKIRFRKRKFVKPLLASLIASPLCSFLPGLGSGQAAILGQTIAIPKKDKKGFIVLLGATNTLVMGFSFMTLYLISKTRTGAAVAISQIIGSFNQNLLILILAIVLISGIISFFLTDYLARFFSKKINKINYTNLSKITLMILCLTIFFVSGILGLLVLIISTLTGIYCISLGVRKTLMMGCLMIPTILLYSGI